MQTSVDKSAGRVGELAPMAQAAAAPPARLTALALAQNAPTAVAELRPLAPAVAEAAPSARLVQLQAKPTPAPVQLAALAPAEPMQAVALVRAEPPKAAAPVVLARLNDAEAPAQPATLVALAAQPPGPNTPLQRLAAAPQGLAVTLSRLAATLPAHNVALVALADAPRTEPAPLVAMGPGPDVVAAPMGPLLGVTGGVVGPTMAQMGVAPATSADLPGNAPLVGAALAATYAGLRQVPAGAQELYLDLEANRQLYSEGFVAYRDGGGDVWLPLADMVSALGLGLEIDAASGVVQGWLNSSRQPFRLELATGRLTMNGKTTVIPASAVAVRDNQVYITSRQLAQWLEGEATLSMGELRLSLNTGSPLPAEQIRARAQRWANQSNQPGSPQELATRLAYRLFSLPQLRVSGGMQATRNSRTGWEGTQNLSLSAEGNLLYGISNFQLGLQRDKHGELNLSDGFLRIYREETSPTLLAGWLGDWAATRVEGGDIIATSVPLSALGSSGRGARISNAPIGQVDDPERFVLTGEAPEGWDIEVYQNQSLLAFQRVDGSGRYSFKALPLRNGLNIFRIVRYGPRGEQDEQEARYNLGGALLAKNQLTYDVALYEPGQKVFPGLNESRLTERSLTLSQRYAYGINSNLTLTAGGYLSGASEVSESAPVAEQAYSLGVRAALGETYAQADSLIDSQGGQRLDASLRRTLPGDVDARLAFGMAENQATDPADTVVRSGVLELSRLFRLGNGMSVDQSVALREETLGNDDQRRVIGLRSGLNMGTFNLTNELEYIRTGERPASLNGAAQATLSLGNNSQLQGQINYAANNGLDVRNVQLGARTVVTDDLTVNSGLGYQVADRIYTATGGLRYHFDRFSVDLSGRTSSDGNKSAMLNVGTLLSPVPGGSWQMSNPTRQVGLAVAQITAFIDTNGDGIRQADEAPVAGVGILNPNRNTTRLTNADGVVALADLPANVPVRLQLDEQTLSSIYLKPMRTQFLVQGHTGATGEFMLPFQQMGEVNGMLFAGRRDGTRTAVAGVMLELVGPAGAVVARARSDSSGFFALGPVPLGRYAVQVALAETQRTGLKLPEKMFGLTAEEPLVEGVELELLPK